LAQRIGEEGTRAEVDEAFVTAREAFAGKKVRAWLSWGSELLPGLQEEVEVEELAKEMAKEEERRREVERREAAKEEAARIREEQKVAEIGALYERYAVGELDDTLLDREIARVEAIFAKEAQEEEDEESEEDSDDDGEDEVDELEVRVKESVAVETAGSKRKLRDEGVSNEEGLREVTGFVSSLFFIFTFTDLFLVRSLCIFRKPAGRMCSRTWK
jgi:hypothetical protein